MHTRVYWYVGHGRILINKEFGKENSKHCQREGFLDKL